MAKPWDAPRTRLDLLRERFGRAIADREEHRVARASRVSKAASAIARRYAFSKDYDLAARLRELAWSYEHRRSKASVPVVTDEQRKRFGTLWRSANTRTLRFRSYLKRLTLADRQMLGSHGWDGSETPEALVPPLERALAYPRPIGRPRDLLNEYLLRSFILFWVRGTGRAPTVHEGKEPGLVTFVHDCLGAVRNDPKALASDGGDSLSRKLSRVVKEMQSAGLK